MKERAHTIRSIRPEDRDEAVATLVAAFGHDPLAQWLFSDQTVLQASHTYYKYINMMLVLHEAIENGSRFRFKFKCKYRFG